MNFDLRKVPFSRYGSYLVISPPKNSKLPDGLYLRTVWGSLRPSEIFRIETVRDGAPVPYRPSAGPAVLRLEAEGGWVELCLAEPELLRVRGQGVGLRLSLPPASFEHVLPYPGGRWEVNARLHQNRFLFSPLQGRLQMDAPWGVAKCERIVADFLPEAPGGGFEGAIESYRVAWRPRSYRRSFPACVASVEREFGAFLKKMPSVPERYAAARELAAYVLWSAVVAPRELLRRPAMLMSKNWMDRVWSWDHCFNAWALCYGAPELAWDQFCFFFDHQDESGVLPDAISNTTAVWNFCKPPVHGWTLRRMLERTKWIDRRRLKEVYEPLSRWTAWWLKYRDWDGDGIPQYNHGNDSGWDNATCFDAGLPLEAPDLSAYLILQMDVLSDVAARLGKAGDARKWKSRGDALLRRLLAHSWREDRFIAPRSGDHRVAASDSLMPFLPLVLGRRLPEGVREKLVAGLTQPGRFLTPHGLATESPKSPLYQPDGYWRGPVWAPPMLVLVDGLAEVGEREVATELSRRFCDVCAASGFAENFDAQTGAGLRDPAYTWTASVFLILAHEYLE